MEARVRPSAGVDSVSGLRVHEKGVLNEKPGVHSLTRGTRM